MEMSLAQELIACLQNDSSYFYYYPDRYGVFLLGRAAERCPRIADLRNGPFAPLLHKPRIKALLAGQGGGLVSADWLRYQDWDPAAEHFRLSLGFWSGEKSRFGWAQTSRRGVNLVLRLDFSASHIRHYRRLIRPEGETGSGPFEYSGHPISRQRETLAWVRLDLDWERGEALIEEVQTDWLRDARWAADRARCWLAAPAEKRPQTLYQIGGKWTDVVRYYEEHLDFHRRYWDEAALMAALWLAAGPLGLRRIWYHSWESGRLFKRCGEPPRSLYTDLPRRFCFGSVEELPALIAGEKRQKDTVKRAVRERVRFYQLEL
jgi:hypothetical protein